MQVMGRKTLNDVVQEYSNLKPSFDSRKRWMNFSEEQLWEELCICILSSNIPYELALSSFKHLYKNNFLDVKRILVNQISVNQISSELSKRIYLPKRKDGSYRKYRFPKVRATNIVAAAFAIYDECDGLSLLLEEFNSEKDARNFFAENVSGVGLKQASHFLRNIGYSKSLAIVDTHVISFLVEIGELSAEISTVTPAIYFKVEDILANLCDSLNLELSLFDMAIWNHMRGKS